MPLSPRSATLAWPFAYAILAAWTLRVLAEPFIVAVTPPGPARQAVYETLRIGLFVLLPLALAVRVEGRSLASPFGLAEGRRPRIAWLLAVAWIGVILVGEWLLRGVLPIRAVAGDLPPIVLGALVTAGAEEFAFRGVLLPRFIARHGPILGQFATALVFVAVHWPGWILLQGAGPADLAGQSFRLLLLALVLGLVTRLSGSLLPAIVLHADNNIAVALFVAPFAR